MTALTAVSTQSVDRGPRSRGLFWALVPVGLLAASLCGVGSMAVIASGDPSFSLEHDYYGRAVHWEQEQAQIRENQRLGYRLKLEFERAALVVHLRDRDGEPVRGASVRAEAFANARAANIRQLVFSERGDGTYHAAFGSARPGLWEFRFRVENAALTFTNVVRADIPAGAARR